MFRIGGSVGCLILVDKGTRGHWMGRIPNRVRNQVVGSSGELMGFVYKIISTKQLHFVWNMYPRRLSNEHHFSKRPHMLCSVWDDFNGAWSCFLLSSKRFVISCREPNNSTVCNSLYLPISCLFEFCMRCRCRIPCCRCWSAHMRFAFHRNHIDIFLPFSFLLRSWLPRYP